MVATLLLFLCLTSFSQGLADKHIIKRHLGWIEQRRQMSSVILSESPSNTYIQVILSEGTIDNSNSEAHGWIFTKGDNIVTLDMSSAQIDSVQTLIFTIKPNDVLDMKAFAVRLDENFYVFDVKPRTPGVPNDAQFLLDQLNDIPSDELIEYEANDKNLDAVDPVMKVRIQNLKKQLLKMNISTTWDAAKRQYILP
jgi:hypothetical protein